MFAWWNGDNRDPVLATSSAPIQAFHGAIDACLTSLLVVTPRELEKNRQVKALKTVGKCSFSDLFSSVQKCFYCYSTYLQDI